MKDENQLHGKVPMENKVAGDVNKVDASGDLGKSVREAEVLNYIEGGGDAISKQLSAIGKEFIVHSETDELYKGL